MVPDGVDRGLVHEVGEIGTRESRGAPGHRAEVDISGELLVSAVDRQNGRPLGLVGQRNLHGPVETPGTQQRRVEDLGPVRGREHHDAGPRFESVHVRQQLVQRLLAFVVRPETTRTALAPDGIDLVDEDDRRSPLAGIGEEVPDARGTHPDEHLDETRTTEGEERNLRLARDRTGQQRLPGTGRPHHEDALRADRPGRGITPGILQDVHDLHDLGLGALIAGDVAEAGRRPFHVVELGLRLPDPHHAAELPRLLAAGPADPDEESNQRQDWQQRDEDVQQ